MAAVKVEVELPEELLSVFGPERASWGRSLKERVVLELFLEGQVSSGKAAEWLGVTKREFLALLDRRDLPYLDSDGALEDQVRVALGAASSS